MDTPERDEQRRDQLTTAPKATDADARPRVEVSEHGGITRVDIAADAEVRPGKADDRD
ncbi:MAG: multidrug transporter [Microbacterium sp.]|uniref:multidrug transporter n=1 Tax=Microbacterium sp. TaxID=51671 RepID=UPI0039E30052